MKKIATAIKLLIPVFIIAVLFSCEETVTPPENTIEVSGVISDEQGMSVPGAIVDAIGEGGKILDRDTTGEDGNFVLRNIPESLTGVTLNILHGDFQTSTLSLLSLKEENKGTDKIPVKIQHRDECCGQIELQVTSSVDESPIHEVQVRLTRGAHLIRKEYTNGDGNLVFENVCTGEYVLRLSRDGFKVVEREVNITECDDPVMQITMQPMNTPECCEGSITITPRNSTTNEIIDDVLITARRDGSEEKKEVRSEGGQAVLDNLCEGVWLVKMKHSDYETVEFEVELDCNETVDYTIEMPEKDLTCCNGVIIVSPHDAETGEMIIGAKVTLWLDGDIIATGITTDDQGIDFSGLCEGVYGIDISHQDYKNIEFEVELKCNEQKPIEKELEGDDCCDGKIYVIPQDAESGEKIKHARVVLIKDGEEIAVREVENGVAVFEELCEGGYLVKIQSEGYDEAVFDFSLDCNGVKELHQKMTRNTECCHGLVRVVVRDSETGEPIEGAKVELRQYPKTIETLTQHGAEGVLFDGVCEGSYDIRVQREGYDVIEFEFEIGCDGEVEFVKEMTNKHKCCNGILKIYVRDSEGNNLNGALVKIYRNDDLVEKAEVREGVAIFDGMCEGKYWVDVIREHYQAIEFEVEFDCNETIELEKTLETKECCNGILKVYVRDKDNNSLNGVKVKLWLGNDLIGQAEVREGIAAFDGLCEGTYGVSIETEHYQNSEFYVEIGCDETKVVEKNLEKKECCRGVIKIYPKNAEGEAINGALVKLWREGKLIETAEVREGVAIFDGLCQGYYGVDILHHEYKHIEFAVELGCDQTQEITKELEEDDGECCNGRMKLIIRDQDTEEPISGARIRVYINDDMIAEGESNAYGHFVREELCAPRYYTIIVSKDGYADEEFNIEYGNCESFQETIWMDPE